MKRILYFLIAIFLITTSLFAQPSQVFTGIAFPYDLVFKGDYLYISEAGFPGNIYKGDINVTEPTNATVVTLVSTPRRMVFKDDILYVPHAWEGNLFKIDVSAQNPTPILVLSGLSNPVGVALKGNDLYFSEADAGRISKIDITDPTPTVTPILSGLGYVQTIAFNGNDLYFCNNDISKFDITDPIPSVTTVVEDALVSWSLDLDIEFYENYLYFSESFGNTIQKLDLSSSSSNPVTIVTGINALYGLTIKNDFIYYTTDLGGGTGSIYKIDINNLSTPDVNSNKVELNIFPNPANEFIQISGVNQGISYSIYSAIGSLIKSGIITDNRRIDIKTLTSGLYFIKFENRNTLKFIIE